MSNESDSDEIPVNVVSENQNQVNDSTEESTSEQTETEKLSEQLDLEKQKVSDYEEKLETCIGRFPESQPKNTI